MKLRFARKKDFNYFFKDEPILYSSKAWVLREGKNRVAIGGVWIMPTQFTSFVRTSKIGDKRSFWKSCKMITAELKKLELPIVCFRDEEQINSKKFLEKLGYRYLTTVNHQEVYKLWAQQQFR
jgi:hypothetical protein